MSLFALGQSPCGIPESVLKCSLVLQPHFTDGLYLKGVLLGAVHQCLFDDVF